MQANVNNSSQTLYNMEKSFTENAQEQNETGFAPSDSELPFAPVKGRVYKLRLQVMLSGKWETVTYLTGNVSSNYLLSVGNHDGVSANIWMRSSRPEDFETVVRAMKNNAENWWNGDPVEDAAIEAWWAKEVERERREARV